jgi:Ca2+-binding RTX toxin-like protein
MIGRGRFVVALAGVGLVCVGVAFTAANTVNPSRAGSSQVAVTANDLKPAACAALVLTQIVTGSGTINGGGTGNLILGGPGVDRIKGAGGDDCILGGGGNDDINGNGGRDVCIGGPGLDTLRNCTTVYQ